MATGIRNPRAAGIWGIAGAIIGALVGGLGGALCYMALYAYAASQHVFGTQANFKMFAVFIVVGMGVGGLITACFGIGIGAARPLPHEGDRSDSLHWTGREWQRWDGAAWVTLDAQA